VKLEKLKWCWDTFGRTDPLNAILTHPDKLGNKWEENQFFSTGIGQSPAPKGCGHVPRGIWATG